jgi:hypothetical protein
MSQNYRRSIEELESKGVMWWPQNLIQANEKLGLIPRLLQTQEKFIKILTLADDNPFQIFEIIRASKFPGNIFLKNLCILADYGGEPIKRLNSSFSDIFEQYKNKYTMKFFWESHEYTYQFKLLPQANLRNKKLGLDGRGIMSDIPLSELHEDMIAILLFGSTSILCEDAYLNARLEVCEVGTLLGKPDLLESYIREKYIHVSRIIGGAKSNSLGQLAQKHVVQSLSKQLDDTFKVISNGKVKLSNYEKKEGMPFDIVVKHHSMIFGIELSFQVTTNSTIERKAGQSANRQNLMHNDGYKIAYIIDGAGNFARRNAISTICKNSDCTVSFCEEEFNFLAHWIKNCVNT